MSAPNQKQQLQCLFSGPTADAAREAASEWLRDFTTHEPFEIHRISTGQNGTGFIATVTYSVPSTARAPRPAVQKQPRVPSELRLMWGEMISAALR